MTAWPTAALLLSAMLLLGPVPTLADDAAAAAATGGGGRWTGPDGRPLPFADDDEALEFLSHAEVLGWKELTSGTTRPSKVFLRWNGVDANAIFRTVDVRERRARLETQIVPDFHDSYVYECAAYEIARVLGIDAVPPCVKRMIDMKQGTLQLWVEDAMMEKERSEEGKLPPVPLAWVRQKQTMRLFDALIFNFDRNQTNMLIDADWKLWFVDHTRSFRRLVKIEDLDKIIWCERGVWQRLQELDKDKLSRARRYLTGPQIAAVLKRRDLLVEHLRALIEEQGEGAVLFDPGVIEQVDGWMERAAAVADDYPARSTPVAGDDGR
jgi:predicted transcriptional regulator